MSFDSLLILTVNIYKNSGSTSGDGQGGPLDAWYLASSTVGRMYEEGDQTIVQGGNTGLVDYSNPVQITAKISMPKEASFTESDKFIINSGEYNIIFKKSCYDQAGLHHYLVGVNRATNNEII